MALPTVDKTCHTLLNKVKCWIAHSGKPESLSLKAIHTDNEFMCAPLREYCIENGIKLTSCAPHTHQQNPIAETTVKMVKRMVRRNESMARTGGKLRALCWTYSGHQLNHIPTTDEKGHSAPPRKRWATAPYQYPDQDLHPWGCYVHGFVGTRSINPNIKSKAHPCIFV